MRIHKKYNLKCIRGIRKVKILWKRYNTYKAKTYGGRSSYRWGIFRRRRHNIRYNRYRYTGKRYRRVTVSRNYGKNYRYSGNKFKKNKSLITIKNKPSQNYSYSRDKKSSNRLSKQASSLFKKDTDLTKTKIDKDYSLKTSKTRVKKSFYIGATIAITVILLLITLKIIFRKKN